MRPIIDMSTVQIEVTNSCMNTCSNCTRLCGHHKKPYFMSVEKFKEAVDSMAGFPKMVGIMGGEPLLHPKFEELCEYMASKIPKNQCGLWTCLPEGKEKYRDIITKTFGHIFINDHTRDDILHAPILVPSDDVEGIQPWKKDYLINKCWVQNTWSASINERGAWFCEVAGALATLLEIENVGWPVEKGWWGRSPQHYLSQMTLCHLCGCAMPLKHRKSTDLVDDISQKMFDMLKDHSPKLKKGQYAIHDCKPFEGDSGQCATYKDPVYRDKIAKRYGMFLINNEFGFQTPFLLKNWKGEKDGKTS